MIKAHETHQDAAAHAEKRNAKLSQKAFAEKRLVLVHTGFECVTIPLDKAKMLRLNYFELR